MKGFKEYITEGITTDYSELLGTYMIPFSEKMWQRITDEQFHTMYGIHVLLHVIDACIACIYHMQHENENTGKE